MIKRNRKKTVYSDNELKQLRYWILTQQRTRQSKRHHEFLFPKFITLTFAQDPINTEHARKLFEAWIAKLSCQPNKKYPLYYLYTIAHGKDGGRLHIHVLLYNRMAGVSDSDWPHGTVNCHNCDSANEQARCIMYIKKNKNNETKKSKNVTNIIVPAWYLLQFKKSRKPHTKTLLSIIEIPTPPVFQAGAPRGAGAEAPALTLQESSLTKDCPTIEILVGITGSGKTHYAQQKIAIMPKTVRVSREDLRLQVTGEDPKTSGYYERDNAKLEKHIAGIQMDQIRYWIQQGYDVILDGPHLHAKYIYNIINHFGHMADIIVKVFDENPAICANRLLHRDTRLTQDQWMSLQRMLEHINVPLNERIRKNTKISAKVKHLITNSTNPECIIVNIDGCLADYRGMRDYHQDELCALDRVVEPMRKLILSVTVAYTVNNVYAFKSSPRVVYITRRSKEHHRATDQWLEDNGFPSGKLIMRSINDERLDYLVKTDMVFNDILPHYKPIMVIEDKVNTCHNVWYKLGIYCLSTNPGLKHVPHARSSKHTRLHYKAPTRRLRRFLGRHGSKSVLTVSNAGKLEEVSFQMLSVSASRVETKQAGLKTKNIDRLTFNAPG